MMSEFTAEFLGTLLLILLGNGVVANVVLKQTIGHGAGWIVITFGWGMAVFVAVVTVGQVSGAHLNPAVTLGLAVAGKFAWAKVGQFILAQLLGAMSGQLLVWLFYKKHFDATEEDASKKAPFCTGPAIRHYPLNLFSEIVGTFVLIFVILQMAEPSLTATNLTEVKLGLGSVGALPVGLLVFAIGLSLGGTTGYAINPARDLAPRIMYAILPMGKGADADWSYSWVPVLGPVLGSLAAALLYLIWY
jgi:glycerol uptake facilitator protein